MPPLSVLVVLALLLVPAALSVRITRLPGLKRNAELSMAEASRQKLSWVIHVQCPLNWSSVSSIGGALDASTTLYAATAGSAGAPCPLTYVAQGSAVSSTLVATCADANSAYGAGITAIARANVPPACVKTLTVGLDGPVTNASTTQAVSGIWHLDRLDQRRLPLDGGYTYALDGSQVVLLHFDTGALLLHDDFGGRISLYLDVINDGLATLGDCNGYAFRVYHDST